MEDDVVGFTFFLNLSYRQHLKDYPDDKITFHDFSSICLNNWESLEEEAKKKIIKIAKKEQDDEIKKEKKPILNNGDCDSPIQLDSDHEDDIDYININKVLEIGELIKKNFSKDYSYSKRSRSSYIYFVKAARIDLKDRIKGSKDNFVEISRAISSKWNELKVSQRKLFEDLALLDKKFNGFKTQQMIKKKLDANHTPLFLKAKAEAKVHHATVSSSSPNAAQSIRGLFAARRTTSNSTNTTRVKRKIKRKRTRTKKRKTTTKSRTLSKVKKETQTSIKRENKPSIKTERKFKIKKEIKVRREF